MTELNFGEQGEKAYLPYAIAQPNGLVNDEEAMKLNTPTGIFLSSAIKPAACNGGAIILGNEVWGIDHVAIETKKGKVIFSGSDKDAIEVLDPDSNLGNVKYEGGIILTNLDSNRIVLAALFKKISGWRDSEFKEMGLRTYTRGNLEIGIPSLFSKIPTRFDIIGTKGSEIFTYPKE